MLIIYEYDDNIDKDNVDVDTDIENYIDINNDIDEDDIDEVDVEDEV